MAYIVVATSVAESFVEASTKGVTTFGTDKTITFITLARASAISISVNITMRVAELLSDFSSLRPGVCVCLQSFRATTLIVVGH